ncbi:response regulator transcription factor [Lysobacter sp. LF1]|uniref:Response regulator transcription factor n=1 Tax=Lysobacter stagni TaxID=3045172 RepID=A0ABT6XED4_9GAMM|nr:response regulator [Lysobacter sp. LF1]MDI9238399.1 response regulator transcription factor [Lysobacter sp. LF1]
MSSNSLSARVLVIDDEPQIRRFLDISLRAQGYSVAMAENGQSGLEALATQGADLVILDLGLPDIDGQDVLRRIRQWSSVPVILLTVRSDETSKVSGLDGGANDYVTKPFGAQELMARVRVLLRTHAVGAETPIPVFDDGRLFIDLARREVRIEGEVVPLTRKEFAMLALLVRHAGRVVTQPHILREVWGPSHEEDTHYLRILVGKLRGKLREDATQVRYIATDAGVGYKFIGASNRV